MLYGIDRGCGVTVLDDINTALNGGDLRQLFINHLGWDNISGGAIAVLDDQAGETVRSVPIAQKRGIPVYLCDSLPSSGVISDLERQAGARTVERLMIFTDGASQVWRWPEARRSGGTRYITHRHTIGTL